MNVSWPSAGPKLLVLGCDSTSWCWRYISLSHCGTWLPAHGRNNNHTHINKWIQHLLLRVLPAMIPVPCPCRGIDVSGRALESHKVTIDDHVLASRVIPSITFGPVAWCPCLLEQVNGAPCRWDVPPRGGHSPQVLFQSVPQVFAEKQILFLQLGLRALQDFLDRMRQQRVLPTNAAVPPGPSPDCRPSRGSVLDHRLGQAFEDQRFFLQLRSEYKQFTYRWWRFFKDDTNGFWFQNSPGTNSGSEPPNRIAGKTILALRETEAARGDAGGLEILPCFWWRVFGILEVETSVTSEYKNIWGSHAWTPQGCWAALLMPQTHFKKGNFLRRSALKTSQTNKRHPKSLRFQTLLLLLFSLFWLSKAIQFLVHRLACGHIASGLCGFDLEDKRSPATRDDSQFQNLCGPNRMIKEL